MDAPSDPHAACDHTAGICAIGQGAHPDQLHPLTESLRIKTMTSVTITFRAKRDTFSGGEGYKVPKLTNSHVSFSDRDTLATIMTQSLNNADMTRARFKTYGLELPGVVWSTPVTDSPWYRDTSAWKITPRGNGFMADITITHELARVTL